MGCIVLAVRGLARTAIFSGVGEETGAGLNDSAEISCYTLRKALPLRRLNAKPFRKGTVLTSRLFYLSRIALATAFMASAVFVPGAASAERAEEVLERASAALTAHESFAVSGVLAYRGEIGTDTEIMDTDYTIAFERPDRASIHVLNREVEIYLYLDGDELTRYIPEYQQFLVEPADSTPTEFVADSGFELIAPVLRLVGELVAADPFGAELAPENLQYIETAELEGGATADRIRFAAGEYIYDVWVDTETGLPRQIEADMWPMEQRYASDYGMDFDFTVKAALNEWSFGSAVEDKLVFAAPEGVEQVEGGFAPPRQLSPAEQLVGQEAPDFTLSSLDGGEVTLSDLRGNTVILDFWATWCGPCRVAMPVLERVSEEFADRGVRLFGVNIQEGPERIKAYLEEQGIDPAVVLDSDGSVAAQYRVEGIPMTVIVNGAGEVAIVHVGLWAMPEFTADQTPEEQDAAFEEALAETLREELRGLIEESNDPS